MKTGKFNVSQTIVVLANLGVIAGIVFLGYELRQTRISLEDSSHLSSTVLSQDSFDRLWEPGFAEVYQLGMKDISSLSPAQRLQFDAYVFQRMSVWEYAFYSYRRGTMDPEIWFGWDANFLSEIRGEAWQEAWLPIRYTYGAGFVEHVERVIAAQ